MDRKYLIVGGHGFIGSYVAKRIFNEEGLEAFDIYDIGEPNGDPSYEVTQFRSALLPPSISWEELGNNHYEYVIHLGSYAGIRSGRDPMEYIRNNVYELQKLINHVDFNKFIYISSSSVLGDVETAYSLSKKIAEDIVTSLDYSLVVRPFTVYGKGGRPEMVITKLVNGEDMVINGEPEDIRRRFTYVEDLVDCILKHKNEPGIINCIGGHVYKLSDLLALFGNTFRIGEACKYDFKEQTFDNARDYMCKTMIEDVAKELKL